MFRNDDDDDVYNQNSVIYACEGKKRKEKEIN